MFTYIIYVLSLTVHLVNNAWALESEKIIDGHEADAGQFPYHVTIFFGEYRCGGALISDRHVLTVAACIIEHSKFPSIPYLISAGSVNIAGGHPNMVMAVADKFYVPKAYFQNKASMINENIAVIRVNRPFNIQPGSHINKINLPSDNKNYADEKAYVTGVGWNVVAKSGDRYTGMSTDRLNWGKVYIYSPTLCAQRFPFISSSYLCGQMFAYHGGLCMGDAGAPLVYANSYIIGVYSYGPENCDETNSPGLYIRVSYVLPFIQAALNDDCSKVQCALGIPLTVLNEN